MRPGSSKERSGSGDTICTYDLRRMKPTSYYCSTPLEFRIAREARIGDEPRGVGPRRAHSDETGRRAPARKQQRPRRDSNPHDVCKALVRKRASLHSRSQPCPVHPQP